MSTKLAAAKSFSFAAKHEVGSAWLELSAANQTREPLDLPSQNKT